MWKTNNGTSGGVKTAKHALYPSERLSIINIINTACNKNDSKTG